MYCHYQCRSGGSVSNVQFGPCGEQFGSVDLSGALCLWRFQGGTDLPLPFSYLQCHAGRASDLCFLGSSVVLATAGSAPSSSQRSLCVWDMLLPPSRALVASCAAHDEGGCCILYSKADSALISGGQRGEVSVFDLRQRKQRERWGAHALAVRSLSLDGATRQCFTASSDGDLKLWDLNRQSAELIGHWPRAHEPHTMLHPLAGTTLGRTYGINCMVRDDASRLLTAGADGKLNLWLCSR